MYNPTDRTTTVDAINASRLEKVELHDAGKGIRWFGKLNVFLNKTHDPWNWYKQKEGNNDGHC